MDYAGILKDAVECVENESPIWPIAKAGEGFLDLTQPTNARSRGAPVLVFNHETVQQAVRQLLNEMQRHRLGGHVPPFAKSIDSRLNVISHPVETAREDQKLASVRGAKTNIEFSVLRYDNTDTRSIATAYTVEHDQ